MGHEDLLIVVDVGNTNTVCGVFAGDEILRDFRFSTDIDRTADEYASLLLPLLNAADLDPAQASGVIICSVVPPLNLTFELLSKRYFHQEPIFVEPGVKTGLSIRYENPTEVGADRIVNGLAARELYGAPVVVVDFGTATTFDVVNAQGEYAGGVIAPGLGISAEALFSHASRLYQIDLRRPKHLVGRNTAGAMQSGLVRRPRRWHSGAPCGGVGRRHHGRRDRRRGRPHRQRVRVHSRGQPTVDATRPEDDL